MCGVAMIHPFDNVVSISLWPGFGLVMPRFQLVQSQSQSFSGKWKVGVRLAEFVMQKPNLLGFGGKG